MVRQPGLYTLASRSDTVQEMLGRAGGMTEGASSRLLFIPTNGSANTNNFTKLVAPASPPKGSQEGIQRVAGGEEDKVGLPVQSMEVPQAAERASATRADAQTRSSTTAESTFEGDPIVIDLTGEKGTSELNLPARPGDLLIVPAAGQVMVDGWVKTPGAYTISNGMTALGAVTAAGGAMFSSSAVLLRTNPDKTKTAFHLDLSKVRSGSQADIPIEASDVVVVQKSVIGAMPYTLYEVFQRFGTGMFIPY
jgi:protein involved in polysaccharide export with SLBB domain